MIHDYMPFCFSEVLEKKKITFGHVSFILLPLQVYFNQFYIAIEIKKKMNEIFYLNSIN